VGLFLGWLARRWQHAHPELPVADTGLTAIAAEPDAVLPAPSSTDAPDDASGTAAHAA